MRVGVNTGEVVVGAAREGGSFVTGDAVNVADRLQKAADPGEVLAGDRTVAAVAVGVRVLGPADGRGEGQVRRRGRAPRSSVRFARCGRVAWAGSGVSSSVGTASSSCFGRRTGAPRRSPSRTS